MLDVTPRQVRNYIRKAQTYPSIPEDMRHAVGIPQSFKILEEIEGEVLLRGNTTVLS